MRGSLATRRHHARFQVLLAHSLDAPLEADEADRLAAHLSTCPICRTIAEGYADDRRLLQALRRPEPPRDLWARTATALDHEVTRPDHRPAAISLGTLAGLAAVLALVGSQIGPRPPVGPQPGATPFAITPQSLAFLTREGDQLALFSTQISEVCPAPVFDCSQSSPTAETFVRVSSDLQPSGLAVGVDGRLLITGRDAHGHAVFGIVRLDEAVSPGSRPVGSGAATSGPAGSSGSPPSPAPSSRRSMNGASSAPTSPVPTPTAGGPSSLGRTAPPSIVPVTPTLPQVQPILSDVIQTGSPAAWSPDGSMLAFSAMPADGAHGPDVYVWRPGDDVAKSLTDDHRSSFACWVDDRILVSRVAALTDGPTSPAPAATAAGALASATTTASSSSAGSPATPAAGTTTAHVETLLLDPASGHSTAVGGLQGAWLPSVDPTGRFVAYWRGTFTRDGPMIEPQAGRLWITTWTSLDPLPSPAPFAGSSPSSTRPQRSTPVPRSISAPRSPASPTPGALPTATPLSLDAAAGPITEWRIRWADDGNALGLWLAPDAAAQVGQLTVISPPDPVSGEEAVLLAPTAAARGAFAMGLDRVAWVVPIDSAAGELRVATWGPLGPGGVRLRQLDSSEGVPAF